MPTNERWLLPILNSSLIEFLLCQITNTLPGGFKRLFLDIMVHLPVMTPDGVVRSELEALAMEILKLEQSSEEADAIEREVDSLVFHAYGLSAPERKLVLDWLGERREALGAEMPADWRKLNTLKATAGTWRGSVDADELMKDIYASRLIDTRPEPRL